MLALVVTLILVSLVCFGTAAGQPGHRHTIRLLAFGGVCLGAAMLLPHLVRL
jgi:hypothetical protein